MELRDYLYFNKIKIAEFSRKLDMLSAVHLYKIVSGKRKPSRRLAKDIEHATGGLVKAEELMKIVNEV